MGNGWKQRKSGRKNAEKHEKRMLKRNASAGRRSGRTEGSSSVFLKTSGKKTPSQMDEGALNQRTKQ